MDTHAPATIESHVQIIGLWSTLKAFADAVGADPNLVATWKFRKSIPPEWWPQTAAAAQGRGRDDITVSVLAATRRARKSGGAAA